ITLSCDTHHIYTFRLSINRLQKENNNICLFHKVSVISGYEIHHRTINRGISADHIDGVIARLE
ncbi:MAG: hypothetical protein J7K64_03505, partial [Bacteroidales bacterium]|nr:hypothetical protein [Bacteroidales bacterium]